MTDDTPDRLHAFLDRHMPGRQGTGKHQILHMLAESHGLDPVLLDVARSSDPNNFETVRAPNIFGVSVLFHAPRRVVIDSEGAAKEVQVDLTKFRGPQTTMAHLVRALIMAGIQGIDDMSIRDNHGEVVQPAFHFDHSKVQLGDKVTDDFNRSAPEQPTNLILRGEANIRTFYTILGRATPKLAGEGPGAHLSVIDGGGGQAK